MHVAEDIEPILREYVGSDELSMLHERVAELEGLLHA